MGGETEVCVGCGARVPKEGGPTHRYIGASAGCWALYGEVQVRSYGEGPPPAVVALSTDAYAAQHPGTPSPQSVSSVAVHLTTLCLVLERGRDPGDAIRIRRAAAARKREYAWLPPPASLGAVTILDIAAAASPAQHAAWVERWARSVWDAWALHHVTVRRWADVTASASR